MILPKKELINKKQEILKNQIWADYESDQKSIKEGEVVNSKKMNRDDVNIIIHIKMCIYKTFLFINLL